MYICIQTISFFLPPSPRPNKGQSTGHHLPLWIQKTNLKQGRFRFILIDFMFQGAQSSSQKPPNRLSGTDRCSIFPARRRIEWNLPSSLFGRPPRPPGDRIYFYGASAIPIHLCSLQYSRPCPQYMEKNSCSFAFLMPLPPFSRL